MEPKWELACEDEEGTTTYRLRPLSRRGSIKSRDSSAQPKIRHSNAAQSSVVRILRQSAGHVDPLQPTPAERAVPRAGRSTTTVDRTTQLSKISKGTAATTTTVDRTTQLSKISKGTAATAATTASGAKDRNTIETLMWSYGLSSHQLSTKLRPEDDLVRTATQHRGGFLLFFLRLSTNRFFTLCCFLVIGANTIFMGLQADAMARHARGELESLEAYNNAETVFIVWFIIESIVRSLGSPVSICKDHMLLFDFVVVTASALEMWVLKPAGVLSSGSVVSIFVVFRVLRLTRAVQLVRTVGLFSSLLTMLLAVWHSKAHVLAAILVLAAFVCPGAFILMALAGPVSNLDAQGDVELERVLVRFSTLGHTVMTLFETLLRGEEWGPRIVRPLLSQRGSAPAGVAFIMLAAIGQVFIMNVIAGVFIEEMFKTVKLHNTSVQQEHIYVDQTGTEGLKEAFYSIGQGEKALTWKQFATGLAMHPDLVMQLGINMELAHALFQQLSFDDSQTVDVDEFVFGLIKMTWQSKTIDMLVIDYQQQRAQKDISRLSARFEKDARKMHESVENLAQRLSSSISFCQPLRSTLKGRLRAHIKRLGKGHMMQRQSPWQATASPPVSPSTGTPAAGSMTPNRSVWLEESPEVRPPPPPQLENWFTFLEHEGRSQIRSELATALGTATPVSGAWATSVAASSANPIAQSTYGLSVYL